VVLKAVVQNALEALGHGGHVEVALRHGAGEVEISVADDGPGITPGERRHLFDPFYSARQAGRGLGMGLAKCWRIVTNHGGRIEVESTPGRGATFTIRLPEVQPNPVFMQFLTEWEQVLKEPSRRKADSSRDGAR